MGNRIGKLFEILTRRERWQAVGLLGAIVVMAFTQTVGIAAVMPFIELVANPDAVMEDALLRRAYETGLFDTPLSFLIFVGCLVLLALVLSSAISMATTHLMLRFAWNMQHRLATRLMTKYLSAPYTYYLKHNSADLSTNLLAEVQLVVTGVLIPALQATARGAVVLFIFALLFAVEPVPAIVIAVVLGGAYGVIYLWVRKFLDEIGRERALVNRMRYKIAGEAFGGIKDVKILGRDAEFVRRFVTPSLRFSRHMALHQSVGQLPRYALEAVAFGGMLAIVMFLAATRTDVAQTISVATLYAVAGYKLMPALQQVFHGLTQVRFNHAAVDAVHRDLFVDTSIGAPEVIASPAVADSGVGLRFEREIRLRGVRFWYPDTEAPAVDGVDLIIPRNRSVALVGSTGSGKTTLADILLGLLRPQEGEITVDGSPITDANLAAWRAMLGYVPQQIFLSDDSVARNIAFGVPEDEIDMAAVERAARTANIHDFIQALPDGYDTVIGERGIRLSGGQRQRIGIARALYGQPQVLILDEATSALDGITEAMVMQAISELHKSVTIVVIAHRLNTVKDCDTIYLLESGRVACHGTYDHLLRTDTRFLAMATASPLATSESFRGEDG
ncbi:MAG TPA: ATP-binding cassette domain-containing protein [Longimicrobiales bacterium]